MQYQGRARRPVKLGVEPTRMGKKRQIARVGWRSTWRGLTGTRIRLEVARGFGCDTAPRGAEFS
jgi:hypothetical protein